MRQVLATLILVLALSAGDAPAQQGDPAFEEAARSVSERMDRRREAQEIGERAAEAHEAGDFKEASALFAEQAELEPNNFVPAFNLACSLALAGDLEQAEAALRRSVELGFSSLSTLKRDPDLQPLRGRDLYRQLVGHWPRILDARRQPAIESAKRWMGRPPNVVGLDELRVDLISGHRERATAAAAAMIERVAAWTEDALIPDLTDAEAQRRDAWVTVILPEDRDFTKWLVWTFGPGAARHGITTIGGAYEHDRKRLVARDLGATLRHEVFHVFHWRDMERRGQRHPIWIQEGLASLVEDMDPEGSGGRWKPVASWRTNIVKRLAERSILTDLETLTGLDQRTFSSRRPLRLYAEARGVFLFLMERGLLRDWYETYTNDHAHGYAADASGLTAIEHVFGADIEGFHDAMTAWAADELPMVVEELDDLDVTLGLEIHAAADGAPRIKDLTWEARRESDLRMGDVITSINGRPIHEVQELVRVLGDMEAGARATVAYRRGTLGGETSIGVKEAR